MTNLQKSDRNLLGSIKGTYPIGTPQAEMEAYDQLPRVVRDEIKNAPIVVSASHRLRLFKQGYSATRLVTHIRRSVTINLKKADISKGETK